MLGQITSTLVDALRSTDCLGEAQLAESTEVFGVSRDAPQIVVWHDKQAVLYLRLPWRCLFVLRRLGRLFVLLVEVAICSIRKS